jgi:hypothetical protein
LPKPRADPIGPLTALHLTLHDQVSHFIRRIHRSQLGVEFQGVDHDGVGREAHMFGAQIAMPFHKGGLTASLI